MAAASGGRDRCNVAGTVPVKDHLGFDGFDHLARRILQPSAIRLRQPDEDRLRYVGNGGPDPDTADGECPPAPEDFIP
jgi:hypothetical protein